MMVWRTLLASLLLAANLASGETVAVIGTGNVGMALGTEFAGLGHTVIYGSRTPDAHQMRQAPSSDTMQGPIGRPGRHARP